MQKEHNEMYSQGVFEEVHRRDVPNHAVIIPSKFFHAIKNVGTKDEEYKARYSADGHLDKMKDFMIHDATNLRHGSMRLITSTNQLTSSEPY